MKPPLTAARFDKLAQAQQRPSGNQPRIIWTLAAIGQRIGAGADFVRDTLAKQEGSPVRQIGGRFYCLEDDLIEYMRNGATKNP